MPQSLKQIVDDLKTNLDTYYEDAVTGSEGVGESLENNEWAMQIGDIYKAAYGEELDLTQITL